MSDLHAILRDNALPGEGIAETLARMEAENAELEADNDRQALELEHFNFWRRYRAFPAEPTPPYMTVYQMNQFKSAQQNTAFVPPQAQAHGPIPRFSGYVKRDILQSPTDPTQEELKRKFLDQPIAELGGQWKGVKAFGEGASGNVGLWECTGQQDDSPRFPKRVVVKELSLDDVTSDLKAEAQIMGRLKDTSFSSYR